MPPVDEDLEIPTAHEAEAAVLGAMMLSPAAVSEARQMLSASDFYRPAHELLFAVICDLADESKPVDMIVTLAELTRRGDLARAGGAVHLHTLVSGVPTTANVGFYAQQVRDVARRRQLVLTGRRLAQIGSTVADIDDAMTAAARESVTLTVTIDETVSGPLQGLSSFSTFLSEPDRSEDWIVERLIERMNIIMMLGRGGSGKSWLARQLALCIAAGVHPFRPEQRITPSSTLLVDLENTPDMVRRQARPLFQAVGRLGDLDESRAHIWRYPKGLNIRQHADAQLLERAIAETGPSLVCIGSLWNLAKRRGDGWDQAAEETIEALNRLRDRYRCAFWIDHHMPHGEDNKRPYGGSEWERFVEFGRAIVRRGENVWELQRSFRADRDVREFPAGLYRGGELPWGPIWSQDEVDLLADAGEGKAFR